MSVLQKTYSEEIVKKLTDRHQIKNAHLVPKLQKVIIHMGIAEITKDKNAIQACENELSLITGQRPIKTLAKVSISNFKLREGQVLGLKTTLRGKRMYDFVYKFCNIVCPRMRDFRGFKKRADGQGNYSLGIDDHQVFPELNLDDVKRAQGMHITFVTSTSSDEECLDLLTELGIPFKKST